MPPPVFSSTIRPTRLSAAYRFGLVVVAFAMLLLPVIYLALIVAAAAAVWWHMTRNIWILNGSGGIWRLIAFLTPVVAGLVLVFFMIKPVLARPAKRTDPIRLDPQREPALFALIDEICRQVRAPRPRRVQVDCAVNASASFMPGPLAMFKRELVLTIGLPLVAGLTVRELTGVLAHEFGHFAQGGGMRLTAVVRGVNHWFGRVVYERDLWDVRLERWTRESDTRLGIMFAFARGSVWVSRKILGSLRIAGHAVSCFMLRQMEHDADSYEIKIAGSDAFVRTMIRLRELNVGAQFAYGGLQNSLASGTLPGDWPTFLVQRSRQLPEEVLVRVGTIDEGSTTGYFDTHPCDADRVRGARAAGASGVLAGADEPASSLIHDFDGLSHAATRHHFEHGLGLSLEGLRLVDTSAALHESQQRADDDAGGARFFGTHRSVFRPILVEPGPLEQVDAAELVSHLAAAQARMKGTSNGLTERYARFDEGEKKRQKAYAALALFGAGFPAVSAEDFDLPEGTAAGAAQSDAQARDWQQVLVPALEAFEAAASRRLSCALALRLRVDAPDAADSEIAVMVEASNALAHAIPQVHQLYRIDVALQLVEANASSSQQPEQLAAYSRQLDRLAIECREGIRRSLSAADCPARFTAAPATVAERCAMPTGGPYGTASEIVQRVLTLYVALQGRLATLALEVEDSAALR